MTSPRPSVIVLAWNRWELTRRCLASIERTRAREEADVILVDNGSTDETTVEAGSFPWVQVIRLPENLGYVRGNNLGIARANPDSDVVLLNNDLVIDDPEWLGKLFRASRVDDSVGIVAPRLVLPDGRLIHAGTYVVPETCWGQTIGREEYDIGQYPGVRDVQGVVFAVAYIRRSVLRRLGPLPEEYVSFFEDTDYSLQARAAGFRVVCTGELTVLHETGATLSDQPERRQALFDASQEVFRRRWKSRLERSYELDVVLHSTPKERRELGDLLIDLLVELDTSGVRIAHRDEEGGDVLAPTEGLWGRSHFARVFAGRPIPDGAVDVLLGEPVPGASTAAREGRVLLRLDSPDPGPEGPPDQGLPIGQVPATRPVEIRLPFPVATSHFHPGAHRVPRRESALLLLARLQADELETGRDLLSAFQSVYEREPRCRLLVLAARDVPPDPILELLKSPATRCGAASLWPDPFGALDAACLFRSVDALVSWRHDRSGSRERWQALACHTPVVFAGSDLPEDGTRSYLQVVPAGVGASSPVRIEAALAQFVGRPKGYRHFDEEALDAALRSRTVRAVAGSIRDAALAIRNERIRSELSPGLPPDGEAGDDLRPGGPHGPGRTVVVAARSVSIASGAEDRLRGGARARLEADPNLEDQTPLIFQHLPKCGGTSLDEMLRSQFLPEDICPDRFNKLTRHDPDSLRRYRFFSGHFDRLNVEHVPKPTRVITLLREPRARVISLYRFWRAHREPVTGGGRILAHVTAARELPLLEFLRHTKDGIPEAIDNFMARWLAGSGVLGPRCEFPFPPEETLRRAQDHLEGMLCYGVLEELEVFIRLLRSRLRLPLPTNVPHRLDHRHFEEYPHLETRDDVGSLSPEVEAELERLTWLDQRLYAWARGRLEGGPLTSP